MRVRSSKRRPEDCRETAVGLLARREHSRRELVYKLTGRGYAEDEVAEALDKLESEGLLSDARFAESYIHSRQQRGYGPLRIAAELRERGVADAITDKYLDLGDAQWVEIARAEHGKKFGESAASDFREYARQVRFLESRGFGQESIRQVLGRFE